MPTSVMEQELVEASGFEPTKDYERQDYLAMLARAMNEAASADETSYDNLSVDAQDWFNLAIKAMNKKQEIPDFPDAVDVEVEEEESDAEEADGDTEEADGEPVEEEPKPAKAKKAKKAGKADGGKTESAPKPKAAPSVGRELDKFGVGVKTQNHAALIMLEQGCRMSDI